MDRARFDELRYYIQIEVGEPPARVIVGGQWIHIECVPRQRGSDKIPLIRMSMDVRVIDLSVDDRWHLENHCYQDLLLLDIGYGTLLVERNQELRGLIESGELEIGDYLKVTVIRFDLLEIPR